MTEKADTDDDIAFKSETLMGLKERSLKCVFQQMLMTMYLSIMGLYLLSRKTEKSSL